LSSTGKALDGLGLEVPGVAFLFRIVSRTFFAYFDLILDMAPATSVVRSERRARFSLRRRVPSSAFERAFQSDFASLPRFVHATILRENGDDLTL